MIQMFCDGVLLYDPRSADYIVAEPKCELEVNKTGNLTFRIAPTHQLYGQIQKLKSEIAVYQDNERLGAFRVLNVEQDFNNIKTVTCEGELAYLLDSVQRAAEYHDVTVAEYFAIVVANHNADVDSSKQFTVGAVTVTDPNDSIDSGLTVSFVRSTSTVVPYTTFFALRVRYTRRLMNYFLELSVTIANPFTAHFLTVLLKNSTYSLQWSGT